MRRSLVVCPMVNRDPHSGPRRPLKVPKGKQPQRAQVARKTPPPEAMFLRRPTQPMPIPTSKRKHVPDACPSTGSPGRELEATTPAPAVRKAEGRAWSSSALHGGQGVSVTDTSQPVGTRLVQDAMPRVQQTQNKPRSVPSTRGQGHTLKPQARATLPIGKSPSIPPPGAGSVCQDSNLSIKAPGKRAAPTSIHLCQKASKKARLGPRLSPQKSTGRADAQPQQEGPLAKTLQPCTEPQLPPIPQSPRQPSRMIFKRCPGGLWSCKLVSAPSLPPAEKPTLCCPEPCHLQQDRGAPSQCPFSILEEDLQVSSSSEDSDCQ